MSFTSQVVAAALMQLIPLIMSLSVHEYAHAAAAKVLGDDTAERAGRLSLNPLVHVDPIGTFALPLALLLFAGSTGVNGLPFFGWAKPTPVNTGRMSRKISQRTAGMLVAAAGPGSNLVLALVCALGLGLFAPSLVGHAAGVGLLTLAVQMTFLNVGLAVFNLLPLGALDGHSVLLGLLPPRAARQYGQLNAQYGTYALIGVVLFGRSLLTGPIRFIAGALLGMVGAS